MVAMTCAQAELPSQATLSQIVGKRMDHMLYVFCLDAYLVMTLE
jgi:hypothetical protein